MKKGISAVLDGSMHLAVCDVGQAKPSLGCNNMCLHLPDQG